MALSKDEIWEKKMKMLFRTLDATKDNFISLEDFYAIGKHFKENSTYKDGDIDDYTEKYGL